MRHKLDASHARALSLSFEVLRVFSRFLHSSLAFIYIFACTALLI